MTEQQSTPTPSTPTGLTARPIRFTADIPAWQRIVEALGGRLVSEHPGWLVYQLGSGRLALHASSEEQPAGRTTLALETPEPLEEAVTAAAGRGVPIALSQEGHGLAGRVTAADGTSFTLDAPTEVAGDVAVGEGRLAVLPIWYTDDTRPALDILGDLGARRRLVGDDGTWADLTCPGGGLVGVHMATDVGQELSFEWAGRLEDAAELLAAAGVEAALIDETYSRTLQVADPDGGTEVWINEQQTDLYGYTLSEM